MTLNKQTNLPIVQPIKILYPTNHNYHLSTHTQIPDNFAICRDCRQRFLRNHQDKGGASYFRCPQCRSNFLERSLVNSCLVS